MIINIPKAFLESTPHVDPCDPSAPALPHGHIWSCAPQHRCNTTINQAQFVAQVTSIAVALCTAPGPSHFNATGAKGLPVKWSHRAPAKNIGKPLSQATHRSDQGDFLTFQLLCKQTPTGSVSDWWASRTWVVPANNLSALGHWSL